MRIRLSCPACGTAFAVADRHAGKVGRCPAEGCGAKVRVPAAGAAEQPTAPSPRTRRAKKKGSSLPVGWIAAGLAAVVAVAAGLFAFLPGGATVEVAAGPSPAPATGAAAPPALPAAPNAAAADRPPLVLTSLVTPETAFAERLGPFLNTYCADCHGPDYAEADIDLAAYASAEDIRADREKWDRVLAIVRVGAMPPSEMDQPTPEERAAAVEWIDRALHEVNCEVVNDPGRVTVRRLNRQEYDNTVRDLLGVKLSLSDDFPSDDVGNGFDNQGDVLTLPPLLLEKYLDAAETIASEAVVGDISTLLTQTKDFSSEGSVDDETRTFKFPEAGDYTIRVIARAQQGGKEKAKYGVTLAGLPLAEVTIKEDGAPETFERTVPVKKGDYPVRVKFLNDFYKPDAPGGKIDRNLYLNAVEVVGPLGTRPTNLPEVHAKIVVATAEDAGGVKDAAEAVFRPLATRAFRRPATDLEVSRLAGLVESVVSGGRSYEEGIQVGLQAVLCSPHFLFRIERDPDDARPGEPAGLNNYELASRLSYFLWSSMPDDELMRLAGEGRLSDDAVLAAQVDRMLDDPKADALVDGFFAQWLNLRMLSEFNPDGRKFGPFWNDTLKASMRRETELLCREIVTADLPVSTFLTADFTFVNPRLAEFYGVPWDGKTGDAMEEFYAGGLPGYIRKDGRKLKKERRRRAFPFPDEKEFRRVELPANRRGVLTHGSILALTSNPTGTSPVKRGKWILDNVLGTPPPPPPPDVPALEATQEANHDLSLREALAKHREDPGCASCHAVMDPLGFAFENFDAVGQYRTKDGRFDIDAAGELPDGGTFEGAVELTDLLAGRSDEFLSHFSRQLMTYALGRGLEWYDRCSVDAVTAAAGPDAKFRALVKGVVLSDPFRKRRAAELAAN